MIDKELIARKTILINKDLEELVQISKKPFSDFIAQKFDVLTERYLERSITRMIDINFHILVESGKAPPPDYFQSFTELSKLGILAADFAHEIAKSAGLRNRLVHEYDEIDPKLLYEYVDKALISIPIYLKHINNYLNK